MYLILYRENTWNDGNELDENDENGYKWIDWGNKWSTLKKTNHVKEKVSEISFLTCQFGEIQRFNNTLLFWGYGEICT